MKKMFAFDLHQYADAFAAQGYVYIPQGLTEEFYALLVQQADEYLQTRRLKEWAVGDKQQALYDFPPGGNFFRQLQETVGVVSNLPADQLVLSERHFKAYDGKAAPFPLPHKDRFASQVSVGFSIHVPQGSTLVLYPQDDLGPNPFNTSAELRASLTPERCPENALNNERRIEIQDQPGDVIMFLGNAIWHMRNHPANTTMLYLKLNAMNCDPLGEDPHSPTFRQRTQEFLNLSPREQAELIPLVGRRVDYFQRRYNRNWQEVVGVVLWGEKHFTLEEDEFRAVQAMNGKYTVHEVIVAMGLGSEPSRGLEKIRKLAARGIVDLASQPIQTNGRPGHLLVDSPVAIPVG